MSFSDLMQSGRGPGVVGIFLALLVLGGFGVLFLFAVDDPARDPKTTTAGIIAEQEKELVELKAHITNRTEALAVLPAREQAERKLREARTASANASAQCGVMREAVADNHRKISAIEQEMVKYQDLYREFSRLGGKGREFEELVTRSGKVYKKAKVREIDAIGMRISYDSGASSGRIPYEELPEDLQDKYQFDPKQRDALVAKERGDQKATEEHVARVLSQQEQAAEDARKKAKTAEIKAASEEIVRIGNNLRMVADDIARLNNDLAVEKTKKFRNTNAILEKIRAREAERSRLTERRSYLQSVVNP